ncbi:UxaA family hydrolase [Castellaniella sp.]|uniref:UxaA family hydrolase n=1 Tax=Castellaniella sp. TaxID=1955812 RepID=UPI003568819B
MNPVSHPASAARPQNGSMGAPQDAPQGDPLGISQNGPLGAPQNGARKHALQGYLRADGRKGIRNHVSVVYLVECAHHVAREITWPYRHAGAHLIGFPGCFSNEYAAMMMERLCLHPNVGAVLLVSLGCECFQREPLQEKIRESGRPLETIVIQQNGGTLRSIEDGQRWVADQLAVLSKAPKVDMALSELVIGTTCGGSDSLSGVTANPVVGLAFDRLVDDGAAVMFEELGELIGCDEHMAERAVSPGLADEIRGAMDKTRAYYQHFGHGNIGDGNVEGGLTTIEEKSIGAYTKSGSRPIVGMIKPGDVPEHGGLYLMDMIPDGPVKFGLPDVNDTAEIVEMVACGCHLILFTTGRGSVVGSALAPVIKICSNPETYRNMEGDMDINAGAIIDEVKAPADVADALYQQVLATAAGEHTKSEALGHQEFLLWYKSMEPIGPACLPLRQAM